VDVVAAVGADQEAAAVVGQGKVRSTTPPVVSEPGAMLSLTASDQRLDAALPDRGAGTDSSSKSALISR
jgi:hypothetical protein